MVVTLGQQYNVGEKPTVIYLHTCMEISVSVQYHGGIFPDIIPLTLCYYQRGTRLNAMEEFFLVCSHLNVLNFPP